MEKEVLNKMIIFVMIYIGILILSFYVIKFYSAIKSEKRIRKFTLNSYEEDNVSLFNKVQDFLIKIVKKFSILNSKSAVLSNYSKRIEKYLIYREDKSISSIDIISMKFLIMIVIDIVYAFITLIKFNSFNFYTLLLVSIVSFFIIDVIVMILYNSKKSLIEEQLLQAVVIMNSSFKSGKNILGAVDIVRKELPSPIQNEFNIIYKDLSYGLSVEEAFNRFYKRINLDEAKYITSSLALLSKTGGNIVTIFNMIEKTFYDRLKIKNEMSSLTSTSKFLYRFLLAIPLIFVLVIVTLNPSYFNPLISTKIGYMLIGIMILIYILYILIIKKIMKVSSV